MGNSIKDIYIEDYQSVVSDLPIRNKSILDITSNFMLNASKVNRAVLTSATSCGCLKIQTRKNCINENLSYDDILNLMDAHIKGHLCDICRERIEKEIGNSLFYIASLCNTLDISLYDVILKDKESISTLGTLGLR